MSRENHEWYYFWQPPIWKALSVVSGFQVLLSCIKMTTKNHIQTKIKNHFQQKCAYPPQKKQRQHWHTQQIQSSKMPVKKGVSNQLHVPKWRTIFWLQMVVDQPVVKRKQARNSGAVILLVESILYHLGWKKLCKSMGLSAPIPTGEPDFWTIKQ